MKIFVSNRTAVSEKTKELGITHILSLLDPHKRPLLHPMFNRENQLLLHFEDNLKAGDPNSPELWHVQQFLDWGKKLPEDSVLLVHCEAGVSRSTAAALALLVQFYGVDRINECVQMLLDVRPFACPNCLISQMADDVLGCDGKLFAASEQIVEKWLIRKTT